MLDLPTMNICDCTESMAQLLALKTDISFLRGLPLSKFSVHGIMRKFFARY